MSILSFIEKFFGWIKTQVKKVLPEIKEVVEIGIRLIENLKNYVNSPGIDALTALIPGDIDDKIVKAIREYLPKLLASLKGVAEPLGDDEIKEYIDFINSREDDAKAILTHGIASAINNVISDGLGSIGQSFITTEVVFKGETAEVKNA